MWVLGLGLEEQGEQSLNLEMVGGFGGEGEGKWREGREENWREGEQQGSIALTAAALADTISLLSILLSLFSLHYPPPPIEALIIKFSFFLSSFIY